MFAWKLASRVLPPSARFFGATLGVRHVNTVCRKAARDRAAQALLPVLRRSTGQSQHQRTTDLTAFGRRRFLSQTRSDKHVLSEVRWYWKGYVTRAPEVLEEMNLAGYRPLHALSAKLQSDRK